MVVQATAVTDSSELQGGGGHQTATGAGPTRRVQVLSPSGSWRECTVLEAQGAMVLVHYQGFDRRHDEWIDSANEPHRIKGLSLPPPQRWHPEPEPQPDPPPYEEPAGIDSPRNRALLARASSAELHHSSSLVELVSTSSDTVTAALSGVMAELADAKHFHAEEQERERQAEVEWNGVRIMEISDRSESEIDLRSVRAAQQSRAEQAAAAPPPPTYVQGVTLGLARTSSGEERRRRVAALEERQRSDAEAARLERELQEAHTAIVETHRAIARQQWGPTK
jgi:hypothetical protein